MKSLLKALLISSLVIVIGVPCLAHIFLGRPFYIWTSTDVIVLSSGLAINALFQVWLWWWSI